MSNAITLMKIFGFIAIVSGLILVLATEPSFKELDAYRTNWDDIQEQLGKNPLGDKPPDPTQLEPGEVGTTIEDRGCWIAEFCPDIPLVSDIGAAILGWVKSFVVFVNTIWDALNWLWNMAMATLNILRMAITFTIPGIPLYPQLLLWAINISMWVAMVYIAFQAITGAVSGGVPF